MTDTQANSHTRALIQIRTQIRCENMLIYFHGNEAVCGCGGGGGGDSVAHTIQYTIPAESIHSEGERK